MTQTKGQSFSPAVVAESLSEMEFRPLADFNEGGAGVFWSEAGGPSPWEMHPDCDELLHVLEGGIEVEILPAEGGPGATESVGDGAMIVVPRGCWHRQTMTGRTKEFYLTPGRTLHSSADDPRKEENGA